MPEDDSEQEYSDEVLEMAELLDVSPERVQRRYDAVAEMARPED